jgi:signal transduction histidine kinase
MVVSLVGRIHAALGVDIVSAAVLDTESQTYRMAHHAGARSPEYRGLRIEPGAGLGGLVVELRKPIRLDDYLTAGQITGDYRSAVGHEGMHGIACVPVAGPDGVTLLLYAGNRAVGAPDDRVLGRLEGLATAAESSLAHLTDSGEVDRAVEVERRRIASRLHESIAQVLFAIAVTAETPAMDCEATHVLDDIAGMARRGRKDLRSVFTDTGHTGPVDLPAMADLEDWTHAVAAELGLRCTWVHRNAPGELAEAQFVLVCETIREALRNVQRHGTADDVIVALSAGSGRVRIIIRNCCPRVATGWVEPASGLGLLTARAVDCNGFLDLTFEDDGPDHVAVLRLDLPIGGVP